MFKLNKEVMGIRSGKLTNKNKSANTPFFFATNNFGGGGTNVARLFVFSDLLYGSEIQLLLNYYYIDINSDSSPRFDTKLVSDFEKKENIVGFIQYIKNHYIKGKNIDLLKKNNIESKKWSPIVLLDSGSGNILRNKIKKKEINKTNYLKEYETIIEEFLTFIDKHDFDVGIAMDFAKKNTYKAGETRDEEYINLIDFFSLKNNELLDITLKKIKENYLHINIFVPLHGDTQEDYINYLNNVKSLEKKENIQFTGFAIGGLGNPNLINKKKWGIPETVNGKVKAALYLYKLCYSIRRELIKHKDDRLIHVLGAASPYNLVYLLLAGMDTFDCHSVWRRASDGNFVSKEIVLNSIKEEQKNIPHSASFSKILIPLVDSKGNPINQKLDNYLEFIQLYKLTKNTFICDCPICRKFDIDNIKGLYAGNMEENYFAKILIYIHGIYQYQYISKKMSSFNSKEEIISFFKSIPESKYKKNLFDFLSIITKTEFVK